MFPFRPLAYQCSNENKHLNALLHVQDFQLLGKKRPFSLQFLKS